MAVRQRAQRGALGSGDKSTQQADITAAQALASTLTTDDGDEDDQDR